MRCGGYGEGGDESVLLSAPAWGGDSVRLVRVHSERKLLKGKKNMSLETICKIENVLGIEIIKNLNEIE